MFAREGSFEFDRIITVGSLKVIPFSCGEKILRRTSPGLIRTLLTGETRWRSRHDGEADMLLKLHLGDAY